MATRIHAAELAALCISQVPGDISVAKLFSLCIFFESWIELGGDETEKSMRLLGGRKAKGLKVIAGGKL